MQCCSRSFAQCIVLFLFKNLFLLQYVHVTTTTLRIWIHLFLASWINAVIYILIHKESRQYIFKSLTYFATFFSSYWIENCFSIELVLVFVVIANLSPYKEFFKTLCVNSSDDFSGKKFTNFLFHTEIMWQFHH